MIFWKKISTFVCWFSQERESKMVWSFVTRGGGMVRPYSSVHLMQTTRVFWCIFCVCYLQSGLNLKQIDLYCRNHRNFTSLWLSKHNFVLKKSIISRLLAFKLIYFLAKWTIQWLFDHYTLATEHNTLATQHNTLETQHNTLATNITP